MLNILLNTLFVAYKIIFDVSVEMKFIVGIYGIMESKDAC